MDSKPQETERDDMSRPGPITFVLLGGAVIAYIVIVYGEGLLEALGLS